MMSRSLLFLSVIFGEQWLSSHAFLPPAVPAVMTTRSSLRLSALTERQMQFWEDVEDGLDDIANFYAKKGEDIDRIRQFGRR
jgi:hypothetical protein